MHHRDSWRIKDQLDVTCYFIPLLICSTCFGQTSCASACNTDTTTTQPHRNSNTHRTKNNTTNVVIQQNSRKLLMIDILISETDQLCFSLQHGYHCNPTTPKLQHTSNQEQFDQCGNSTEQSQAPGDGYINVRDRPVVLQPSTRIPLQRNHTETSTHIEPRKIRPMW